jgi:preprotein translocase subunit SecE
LWVQFLPGLPEICQRRLFGRRFGRKINFVELFCPVLIPGALRKEIVVAEKAEKTIAGKSNIEKAKVEKPKAEKPKSDKPNFLQRWWIGIRRWFNETIGELRKVKWPTRKEAVNLTIIVIVVTIAMAIFLGGLDFIFTRLMALII